MSSRVFVRSLAAAAKAGVKPPIQLFGLEGTYASALFTAASKTTSIESAGKALASLSKTIAKDAKLGAILANPALPAGDRTVVVQTLAQKTPGMDAAVQNLMQVLAENNRLNLLQGVAGEFTKLTDAHNGLVQATVTTAQPLEGKLFRRVEKALAQSSFIGAGKTLKLENVVKPEIQGGLIVEVADRTVDLSIASRISKLNQVLKESI
ncbi:AAL065Cp [Eremothecium gossypii ATCC 10895]|uniref:ATP synthase subunit 5, mitochondrial n=1 Tax=Eremothecium gossypii (strain ATCC 10895 / CBS 109.51 / FGSC 9923 / NRRL Y-1056) TaxID=284811 RepID=ATPO_EREGS|nr:AAL065Cp [Eremothecium gossypii ATCC 10895]Q75EZ3.1 RecName: Full=ATP synthase subunit 5, mitochondrial; Short=ATP synthase chain 5; AltName: Full=Oligomycin sensitivity conferral protein; Short=OSCP; Flags: Precursor [Eremothecium gossypii ATCC 10895]AAS50301.1 AAL065Cp [Eremothecium gossypii ATCC 10895]AEY94587.1 FAAL065Cp [Eremothecium gossypii FDAG1]